MGGFFLPDFTLLFEVVPDHDQHQSQVKQEIKRLGYTRKYRIKIF
jgi:hypothetical protein